MLRISDGPIGPEARPAVGHLLARAWGDLRHGGDASGLAGYKRLGRAEDLSWSRPWLSFTIAAQGTALVPTGAVSQHWSANVETGDLHGEGFRQVLPLAAALRVGPLVEELVGAIRRRRDHLALKWLDDASVRVTVAQINELRFDPGSRQTIADSRKRFREALTRRMAEIGWQVVPSTRIVFERRDRV